MNKKQSKRRRTSTRPRGTSRSTRVTRAFMRRKDDDFEPDDAFLFEARNFAYNPELLKVGEHMAKNHKDPAKRRRYQRIVEHAKDIRSYWNEQGVRMIKTMNAANQRFSKSVSGPASTSASTSTSASPWMAKVRPFVIPTLGAAAAYAGAALAPKVPESWVKYVHHPASLAVAAFLIVWFSTRNPQISTIIAISYLVLLHATVGHPLEHFNPTVVIPQCRNVKLIDLENSFSDKSKMIQSIQLSGIPLNTPVNDRTAPLIATYLVNAGFKVAGCAAV
ncbi:hypothetical protein HK102_008324 [Quaeritorhiza haematococci]|nr:hypothetical protein HK102_008324 [Quaeritorhiza haematococci]